jgi:hypothetical protein
MPRPTSFSIARSLFASVLLALATVSGAVMPAQAQESPPAEDPPEGTALSHVPRTVVSADGPQGDFPAPPPRGKPRAGSLAVSIGPGWLALRDDIGRDGQAALAFGGRLGMVIFPEWNVTMGLERTRTSRGEATFSQTAALIGAQRFFFGRVYLGAAAGLAWVQESGVPDPLTDGPGLAASAAVGVEALRGSHFALTAELSITGAQYKKEAWEMGGLRLGLIVF